MMDRSSTYSGISSDLDGSNVTPLKSRKSLAVVEQGPLSGVPRLGRPHAPIVRDARDEPAAGRHDPAVGHRAGTEAAGIACSTVHLRCCRRSAT